MTIPNIIYKLQLVPVTKLELLKFGHMQKGLKQHCPLNVYLFLSISPASFPVLPPMFLFTWTFITLNYGGKSFHEKLRIAKLFCGCQGYRALEIFGCKNKRLFPQVFLHPDSKLSNKQSIETSKKEGIKIFH